MSYELEFKESALKVKAGFSPYPRYTLRTRRVLRPQRIS